ncbi:MAG TPA: hypothetical protein VGR37_15680 [Longimicrobiaceae bacterium]|nr:hypothetical protein [Longimicrobiaceae bacterium]
MSVTEHLLVFISMILSLGLADLLTSVHRLVHARKRVRFDWLPVAWAAFIFLLIVQYWWSSYTATQAEVWQNFFGFAFLLLSPVVLYLAAASVLPDVEAEGLVDMRAHYFEHRTWFFLLGVLLVCLIVATAVLRGHPFLGPGRIFHAAFLLISITLAWTANRRVHAAVAAFAIGLLVLFIVSNTLRIG